MAKDSTAFQVLETSYPIQKVTTLKMKRQLKTASKHWGLSPEVQVQEFLESLIASGKQAVLPAFTFKQNDGGGSANGKTEKKPNPVAAITHLAVFNKDKLRGFLSMQDAKNYMWIQGSIKQTELDTFCKAEKKRKFMVRLYDIHTGVKAFYKDGIPHFQVNIQQEGRIDSAVCNRSLLNNATYKEFNKRVNESVEKDILQTIHKVQTEFKADIFGFGERMYRQNYKQFKKVKNWNEEFVRAKIQVNVTTNLNRSGIRTNSFIDAVK
ncbi:Ger(x)C family spore germination C-terminal domain-containing protein [Ectobacillus panaciterrae]|uniref:Ger(x)C family spore germination protein n=1 Tax=Ectobacillus panaciterrae TaxID=363872 RepID=UPI0004014117